ncbi:hypothetical protein [Loktanella sp. S4079]|uniref:hypothetical protein n=1 Tax=Loktanella sp. S4079 TaxID=579483 RepID=UPI0005F9B788|nr:hypothetical protein [Loktanella sp. S4079]KJZ20634.1 hypothetical protein TW80_07635 [Loktanella sp. S4079]
MQISLSATATRALFLLLLCIGVPNFSVAQPERLDGKWAATNIVSTGISGARYWERISPLLGNTVIIDGKNVQISQELKCTLADPALEIWKNGMHTFGSGGGDWSQLGLETTGSQSFEVYTRRIDCPPPNWPELSIVTQSINEVLLLGSHRVFAVLHPDDEQ